MLGPISKHFPLRKMSCSSLNIQTSLSSLACTYVPDCRSYHLQNLHNLGRHCMLLCKQQGTLLLIRTSCASASSLQCHCSSRQYSHEQHTRKLLALEWAQEWAQVWLRHPAQLDYSGKRHYLHHTPEVRRWASSTDTPHHNHCNHLFHKNLHM